MSRPAVGKQKTTVPKLLEKKQKGEKIVALTAYDATFARLEDKAGVDIILVGDSANMVVAGEPDTLSISLDEMVYLTRYASRGVKNALLAADMPFGSYQVSKEQAIESALRLVKEGGAEAVKIEGGEPHFDAIHRL
ncbi:3-methyl-2-oxobutanoate hydroxymethyltransferase, partial [bacterium]|nr:3-methyl-2-oxobutanoate hydroxymethyltransferase [bacterium]